MAEVYEFIEGERQREKTKNHKLIMSLLDENEKFLHPSY